MTAARGDRKPCSVAECTGTMQYGRRQDQDPRSEAQRADPASGDGNVKGWVCNVVPEHFQEQ
jgi:hypothetical protein